VVTEGVRPLLEYLCCRTKGASSFISELIFFYFYFFIYSLVHRIVDDCTVPSMKVLYLQNVCFSNITFGYPMNVRAEDQTPPSK
jgi:hypothetical protein